MLLTDGSVLVGAGGDSTPLDAAEARRLRQLCDGTWSQVASSHRGRLYYPSFIMKMAGFGSAEVSFIQDRIKTRTATGEFTIPLPTLGPTVRRVSSATLETWARRCSPTDACWSATASLSDADSTILPPTPSRPRPTPCRMAAKQASKPRRRNGVRPDLHVPAIPAVFESVDRDSYGTDHRIDPR